MQRRWVGDDVVDRTRERARGKADDARFLGRVLTGPETAAVRASADPDGALWTFWACKEAAFKIHSKARGRPPTFVHAAYRVRLDAPARGGEAPPEGDGGKRPGTGGAGGDDLRTALVLWDGGAARVRVRRGPDRVHAVGWGPVEPDEDGGQGEEAAPGTAGPPSHRLAWGVGELDDPTAPWAGAHGELLARLSPAEADAVHSRASAAVRLAARATLADLLGVEEGRLEIVCAPGRAGQRPPSVRLDGGPAPADVSFTHDGRWLAWSVLVPR